MQHYCENTLEQGKGISLYQYYCVYTKIYYGEILWADQHETFQALSKRNLATLMDARVLEIKQKVILASH